MKKLLLLAIFASVFALQDINAQPTPPGPSSPPSVRPLRRIPQPMMMPGQPAETSELTRFNLDFPGGTPKQLADAIEKAMAKPLNVIIPPKYSQAQIPPIRVNDVTVPQLFETLQQGSRMVLNNQIQSSYGFDAIDGPRSDNTIWTFFVNTNQMPGPLTKFSIDFPGGEPRDLVAAIERATGRPLNVIVPEEYAGTKLPALKMNNVDVDELFHALQDASLKTESYLNSATAGGYSSYSQMQTGYGFKTDGRITDESIWYFYVMKLPPVFTHPPEKICRFYALAPYLDNGLKVDDITTAVETAWKMAGESNPPAMSFHKDTKLLIAVGDPEKLKTIDAVLQALKPETPKPPRPPVGSSAKKSGEDKSAE